MCGTLYCKIIILFHHESQQFENEPQQVQIVEYLVQTVLHKANLGLYQIKVLYRNHHVVNDVIVCACRQGRPMLWLKKGLCADGVWFGYDVVLFVNG
jgi:sulfopyruvate decarboxylase TPP-binding subunit